MTRLTFPSNDSLYADCCLETKESTGNDISSIRRWRASVYVGTQAGGSPPAEDACRHWASAVSPTLIWMTREPIGERERKKI